MPGLYYSGHGWACRAPERTHESASADIAFGAPFRGTKDESVFRKIPGVVNVYRAFVFDGMHQIKNVIKRWVELLKGRLVPKKPVWGENSRVTLARRDVLIADWRAQVEKHRAFTLLKAQQNEVDQRWGELPCPPGLINHGYGFSNTLVP